MSDFAVVLHCVGRNLNRCVRTCEAFGISKLLLHECDGRVRGNLYGASDRVLVSEVPAMPTGSEWLALETGCGPPLSSVDWNTVSGLLIGGETSGLPRNLAVGYAHIPMQGRVSGLTVEAALAIALYARSAQ